MAHSGADRHQVSLLMARVPLNRRAQAQVCTLDGDRIPAVQSLAWPRPPPNQPIGFNRSLSVIRHMVFSLGCWGWVYVNCLDIRNGCMVLGVSESFIAVQYRQRPWRVPRQRGVPASIPHRVGSFFTHPGFRGARPNLPRFLSSPLPRSRSAPRRRPVPLASFVRPRLKSRLHPKFSSRSMELKPMDSKPQSQPKDGQHCRVVAGTHAGKSGIVRDINTSRTGHMTITVVQANGDRFKTLAKNVVIETGGST